jgi:hypothetical protein
VLGTDPHYGMSTQSSSGIVAMVLHPPDLTPLVGCIVGRLTLDYQVTLMLASQGPGEAYAARVDAHLTIGAAFQLTRAGRTHVITPDATGNYQAVVGLLHATVSGARIGTDESLVMSFSGDQLLRVPRDPAFESWEISGRGIRGWLAGPL